MKDFLYIKKYHKVRLVVHVYNPSTQEVEVEGSQVQGQPGTQSQTPLQKERKKISYSVPRYVFEKIFLKIAKKKIN
jgi:hypothetical protein